MRKLTLQEMEMIDSKYGTQSIASIARDLNLRYLTVYMYIRRIRQDYPTRKIRIWTEQDIKNVVELYRKGQEIGFIAQQFGVSDSVLRQQLFLKGYHLKTLRNNLVNNSDACSGPGHN